MKLSSIPRAEASLPMKEKQFWEKKKFKVTSLQLEGEVIIHKGSYLDEKETEGFKVGQKVTLKIDEAKRRLYARVHSAGHLLDQGFHALGFTNEGTRAATSLTGRMSSLQASSPLQIWRGVRPSCKKKNQ
eukprot:TRINITY_DN8675_c0_g1_i3.p2 TRINITY_DN8675_c0_g1~~TRINITY_DN8675_c0_g1_i3.p2  ORF type:complete len:130 (-),score=17.81 TRINITY_DN8675_c0_g1_i3:304-693(-)